MQQVQQLQQALLEREDRAREKRERSAETRAAPAKRARRSPALAGAGPSNAQELSRLDEEVNFSDGEYDDGDDGDDLADAEDLVLFALTAGEEGTDERMKWLGYRGRAYGEFKPPALVHPTPPTVQEETPRMKRDLAAALKKTIESTGPGPATFTLKERINVDFEAVKRCVYVPGCHVIHGPEQGDKTTVRSGCRGCCPRRSPLAARRSPLAARRSPAAAAARLPIMLRLLCNIKPTTAAAVAAADYRRTHRTRLRRRRRRRSSRARPSPTAKCS